MKIEVNKENEIITFKINENTTIFEVETTRRQYDYWKNIKINGLIYEGFDLFQAIFIPQLMYVLNNNNINYSISNSNNITKINTIILEPKEIKENILTINYNDNSYEVIKYIHDLNHSTQLAERYLNTEQHNNLSYEDANSIILNMINTIQDIPNYQNYINMDKLTDFFNKNIKTITR